MDMETRLNKNILRVLNKIKVASLDLLNEEIDIEYQSVDYPVFEEQEFNYADEEEVLGILQQNQVIGEMRPVIIRIVSEKNPYLQRDYYRFWVNKELFLIMYEKLSRGNSSKKVKLILFRDGRAIYLSKSGKQYEGEFSIRNNPYLLLKFLAANPKTSFNATELEKQLNMPRGGVVSSTEERRVRDTIQGIRVVLGLNNNNPDDFFIVSKKEFGINCDVELKT